MQKSSGLNQSLKVLLFIFTLVANLAAQPISAADKPKADETVSQDSFDAYKELADTKLQAIKESLQKEIEKFSIRSDAQDKNLEQQNNRIGDINTTLTVGGLLLALGAIAASMIAYFSVKARVREEAQKEAKQWFERHSQQIREQIAGFEQEIAQLQGQAKAKTEQHHEQLEELRQQAEHSAKELQMDLNHKNAASHPQTQHSDLQKFVETLVQQKLEGEYTFDDWNKRALAAYEKRAFEEALYHWNKALKINDITEEQEANTLLNLGILHNTMERHEDAYVIYNRLLEHFANSTDPRVQNSFAKATLNKGWTQREKFDDPQGAVATYDELQQRFATSTIPGIQELYANSMSGKSIALVRMDDRPGAVACYDDMLARYSHSENPAIQAQCQIALGNTIEPLLVWGRNAEAVPRIRQVLAQVDASNQKFAIMPFLLWLAGTDSPISEVLAAILALSPDVQFTWGWDDIRPLVEKLPEPRKTQAECFIAFFEQHHDMAILKACLLASTEWPEGYFDLFGSWEGEPLQRPEQE